MLSEHTPEEINDYVEQTVQARTPRKSRRAGTTTEALALSDTPSGELTPQEASNSRSTTSVNRSMRRFWKRSSANLPALSNAPWYNCFRRWGMAEKQRFKASHPASKDGASTALSRRYLPFRPTIQAKRYGPNYAVQRDEVQKYLSAHLLSRIPIKERITTSYFTSSINDYVKGPNGAAHDRADRRQATGRIHLRFQTGYMP